MSYQVLARKYRPSTFSEVVGQEHILKALENSIQHNNKNNVILAFNECFRLLKPNGKMFSAFLIEGDNNFILSKISQSDLINIVSKNFNIDEKNYASNKK